MSGNRAIRPADQAYSTSNTPAIASPSDISPKLETDATTLSVPYTAFSPRHKRLITVILTLTMLASPLTATIYLPLLPLLASHFRVSLQAINLTITLYIVFQAISPVFFATASDSFGRRPVYLVTYTIYTAASLGLALNRHNYAALIILRALQSLGASAVLAIAFGVAADLSPPAERGSILGLTQGAANLAVCLGPVIGGWVALGSGGFEWVFWALVIFGGTVLCIVAFALPETARNVVGNGSKEATGWNRTVWNILTSERKRGRKESNGGCDLEGANEKVESESPEMMQSGSTRKREKFKLANPLAPIRIILWKDTALILWMAGSPYAVWYCVQASIPTIYKDVYGFNEIQIGLSYLTGGVGVVFGGYANGKLMDRNYKITAREAGHAIDKVSGDNLSNFPIERARSRGSWCLLTIYICALTGYGWSVQANAHESVPLMLQFVLAALCTSFQQTFNALLVDIFPASPSTAAASSNITRCALSAVAVAVLEPLVKVMGRGWFFTLLTVLSGGGGLVSNWIIRMYGMEWRQRRLLENKESFRESGSTDMRIPNDTRSRSDS